MVVLAKLNSKLEKVISDLSAKFHKNKSDVRRSLFLIDLFCL